MRTGILEMGQNILHLVHAWRVLDAFTCVKLLWGHQKHLVHFHSMCPFPRKERSFEEQITCPPQPNSLGRLSKYFLEHGLLIRPLWPVLSQLMLGQDLTVWAKSGMGFWKPILEHLWLRPAKSCQECLVPSPWRVTVFNEKTQLWKLRHSMHYPYSLKLEQNPRKPQTPPIINTSPFSGGYLIQIPWKLFYKNIPRGSICQATVPSLPVQADAGQCGGGAN